MILKYPTDRHPEIGDRVTDGDRMIVVHQRVKNPRTGLAVYYSDKGEFMTEAWLRYDPPVAEAVELVHVAMLEDARNGNTEATKYVLAAWQVVFKLNPELRFKFWHALTPQQKQYIKRVKENC